MNLNLHPKVAAGTLAGAVVGIIIAELARYGITIAPDEASNITVILSFLAGYITPETQPPTA